MIPPSELQPITAALGFGVLHALTPCAHSWPVLLPLVARARTGNRVGIMFGAGMFLSSVVVGGLVGGFGGALTGSAEVVVENVIGAIMVLLGLSFALKPQWMHGGHMHGDCSPSDGGHDEPHCGHAGHHPVRFLRFGPDLGAALLGIANMALPCFSNFMGVTLTVEAGTTRAGALVLGCYGFSAAVTTVLILSLFRHGVKLSERLMSPRFETILLRLTGTLTLVYGLALLLHLGHDHHH